MKCTLIYKGEFSGSIQRESLNVKDEFAIRHLMEELVEAHDRTSMVVSVVDYSLTKIPILKAICDGAGYERDASLNQGGGLKINT